MQLFCLDFVWHSFGKSAQQKKIGVVSCDATDAIWLCWGRFYLKRPVQSFRKLKTSMLYIPRETQGSGLHAIDVGYNRISAKYT